MRELREDLLGLSEQAGEPTSFQDLARARRRRSSRRRAGGLVVGLLVFAAAGVFLVTTFRDQRGAALGDPVPSAWTTYTDPYGWTIDVPEGWRTRATSEPANRGARFEGNNMSVQISIEPATSESLPPGMTLPPGLTVPPQNDSQFPLHADQLLSNVEGGLGGHFFGDGQRFNVLVLSPSLPGPLPETDAGILDHMIGSISFQPWRLGEVRNGWEAIATPTEDVSWVTVRGGTYILFRTTSGYRLYGAISCGETRRARRVPRPMASRSSGVRTAARGRWMQTAPADRRVASHPRTIRRASGSSSPLTMGH